jgi:hypothetical protein
MNMHSVFWLIAGALLTQQVFAKDGNISAYTELNLDECQVISKSEEDESLTWRCEGYEGMPVYVAEGDLRMFVSFGDKAKDERAATQTFGSFNRIHTTLEWRITTDADGKKRPIATILRYFLTVEGKPEHQILVVSQVKPAATCHIAYIDAVANKKANEDARAAADRLGGTFDCEVEPEIVGPQTVGIFAE